MQERNRIVCRELAHEQAILLRLLWDAALQREAAKRIRAEHGLLRRACSQNR